jgi:hypothetical protein
VAGVRAALAGSVEGVAGACLAAVLRRVPLGRLLAGLAAAAALAQLAWLVGGADGAAARSRVIGLLALVAALATAIACIAIVGEPPDDGTGDEQED